MRETIGQGKMRTMALMFGMAVMACGVNAAFAQGPPPPGYGQGPGYQQGPPQGWEAPPGEFQEVQRRGFHDGIEGARKDYENHRRPDVNNRDEYRHPDVPHDVRRDYRQAFRRGYQIGVQHIYNGGGGPRPY